MGDANGADANDGTVSYGSNAHGSNAHGSTMHGPANYESSWLWRHASDGHGVQHGVDDGWSWLSRRTLSSDGWHFVECQLQFFWHSVGYLASILSLMQSSSYSAKLVRSPRIIATLRFLEK